MLEKIRHWLEWWLTDLQFFLEDVFDHWLTWLVVAAVLGWGLWRGASWPVGWLTAGAVLVTLVAGITSRLPYGAGEGTVSFDAGRGWLLVITLAVVAGAGLGWQVQTRQVLWGMGFVWLVALRSAVADELRYHPEQPGERQLRRRLAYAGAALGVLVGLALPR